MDEFIGLIKEEAEKLGLDNFDLTYAEGAEQTPFIYDLNCESTREAFPKMPQTEIREGIRVSLIISSKIWNKISIFLFSLLKEKF